MSGRYIHANVVFEISLKSGHSCDRRKCGLHRLYPLLSMLGARVYIHSDIMCFVYLCTHKIVQLHNTGGTLEGVLIGGIPL